MLSNVRIVLVETSHPGNIGAVARAMKNMCLRKLMLVQPKIFPHADATARAAGADDLLATAEVTGSLSRALQGCRLVIGVSARQRALSNVVVGPREGAAKAWFEAGQGEVAFVFGREDRGLTNEELSQCNFLLHIPSNSDFASLNLAAAVQLVAWEVLAASQTDALSEPEQDEVAPAEDMERFYVHLEETLIELEFLDPDNPRQLIKRLRRLFNRARPDPVELNILRGMLTAAQGRNGVKHV